MDRLHVFYEALYDYEQGQNGYVFSCDELSAVIPLFEKTDECKRASGADEITVFVMVLNSDNNLETKLEFDFSAYRRNGDSDIWRKIENEGEYSIISSYCWDVDEGKFTIGRQAVG